MFIITEELCHYIVYEWNHLDQCVTDTAIKQWRKSLQACVATDRGQFEQAL